MQDAPVFHEAPAPYVVYYFVLFQAGLLYRSSYDMPRVQRLPWGLGELDEAVQSLLAR